MAYDALRMRNIIQLLGIICTAAFLLNPWVSLADVIF